MWHEKRRFIIWGHQLATIGLVKLDIAEDDIPLLVRALEHYAAYLEATPHYGSAAPCKMLLVRDLRLTSRSPFTKPGAGRNRGRQIPSVGK